MTTHKVLLTLAMCGATVGALGMRKVTSAAPSCAGPGALCFYDYKTRQFGNVFGNNSEWRAFGWNDRADVFRNLGIYANACVYKDSFWRTRAWFIPRNGQWYNVPDDTVRSNRWTSGPSAAYCF